MDIHTLSRKEVGNLGEKVAADYLVRHGLEILARNYARKTGELDLVARAGDTLHFVEVKTMVVDTLPTGNEHDAYDPSSNLHEAKLRHVARTGEWYVMEHGFDGEWQVDGVLVWLRRRDGLARVRYLPQLV